ncbi:sensor histidine kinase [Spirosoma montaniterrae]|uniref:Sensor protein lytS n=1 Tax=Spirosoma montaniterrae TaxID=1178516 RepID=A0A1P9WVM0_9BACT|nr:histidine kinase [Spirosoma montaniterrae]AQG79437.1 sensor protein lytS [Spirosoma montaniterrae]
MNRPGIFRSLLCGLLLAGYAAMALPDTIRVQELARPLSLYNRATLTPAPLNADWLFVRTQPAQPLRTGLLTTGQQAYWLHVCLQNDSPTAQTVYLSSANNQVVSAFVETSARVDSLRFGTMIPAADWPTPENEHYAPLRLAPRQTCSLWIQIARARSVLDPITASPLPRPRLGVLLLNEQSYRQTILYERQQNAPELLYRSWIQGALLFFLLLVVLLYSYDRQRLYLFYGLYVLAGCLYSLLKTRSYTPLGHWFGQFPLVKAHLLDPIVWAGWGAYLYFLIELLDLNRIHPVVSSRMRWCARVAVVYSTLYAGLLILTNDEGLQQLGYWFNRGVFIGAHVWILGWVARAVPSILTRYVLIGNALLTGIGILASLRAGGIILRDTTMPGYVDNLLMLPLGILLEIIVFGIAMAHRIRLIDRERQASQTAYIEEIEQRTAYEKRLAEVEMLALRSQMNPHFLFNSLNTIEYFVLKGDEEKASRYLSNFSRLLRLILNHSNEDTVRLSEELTGLRLYLELEATRFGDEFQYSIETNTAIDQDEVLLPPLLLQPFVENAIWHGLRQSKRPDKRLWVRLLVQDAQTLRFEIEDNGIGRQRAADLKSRSASARKSYGMAITQQRIELFNRNYPSQLDVQLLDLEGNEQTGTLVRMTYRLALSLQKP